MKGLIAGIVGVVVIALIFLFSYASKDTQEVKLRNQVIAQNDVCRNHFDNMFKVIAQTAQVPSEFMEQSKEAFKEIYQPLIEGRYRDSEGEQRDVLMNWVHESNPQFDMAASARLYERLQVVVESQRNEFTRQQDMLIDMHRQHKVFCTTFWNRTIFGMDDRLIPTCDESSNPTDDCIRLIDSQKTEEVYNTGQDNDIELF